jgi:hypothetical protein
METPIPMAVAAFMRKRVPLSDSSAFAARAIGALAQIAPQKAGRREGQKARREGGKARRRRVLPRFLALLPSFLAFSPSCLLAF